MIDFSHLDTATIELLDEPLQKRVDAINRELFVPYPFATEFIDAMMWRMSLPQGSRRPCIALGGESGLGKTHLIAELLDQCGIDRKTGLDENGVRTVFLMDCTSLRSAKLFRMRFSNLVGCAVDASIDDACKLLKKSPVRLIVFDEAHTLRDMKPRDDFVDVCNYLKQISNDCERPMLMAGDVNVGDMLVSDNHLATRFKTWKLEPWRSIAELRDFVDALLSTFPLPEASPVTDDTTLSMIIEQTKGNTESIVLSLRRTAVLAAQAGGRRVSRTDWLNTLRRPY